VCIRLSVVQSLLYTELVRRLPCSTTSGHLAYVVCGPPGCTRQVGTKVVRHVRPLTVDRLLPCVGSDVNSVVFLCPCLPPSEHQAVTACTRPAMFFRTSVSRPSVALTNRPSVAVFPDLVRGSLVWWRRRAPCAGTKSLLPSLRHLVFYFRFNGRSVDRWFYFRLGVRRAQSGCMVDVLVYSRYTVYK
jgi:hypothetical protein